MRLKLVLSCFVARGSCRRRFLHRLVLGVFSRFRLIASRSAGGFYLPASDADDRLLPRSSFIATLRGDEVCRPF